MDEQQRLQQVARDAAVEAGGVPVELLGDFLTVLTLAARDGRPVPRAALRPYRALGDRAAREGVALRALLDLYLAAAWRLWPQLPAVQRARTDPQGVVAAGDVLLRAVADVVAALAEGFQLARRALVRSQVSARREFVDDLLGGTADRAGLLRRAAGFDLDLAGPHAVAVVRAQATVSDSTPQLASLDRAMQGSKGDAQALVASKEGQLVVVFAAPDPAAVETAVAGIGRVLGPQPGQSRAGVDLRHRAPLGSWRAGVGRAGRGPDGVARSYRQARDVLDLADRLGLPAPVVQARDMLVYEVLLRDRPALLDLVESTLAPLQAARGGAGPLLRTLSAFFAAGANVAQAARDLHLSVRAMSYRLARIRELTGYDPAAPGDRFTLQVAALGAQLIDWPGAA